MNNDRFQRIATRGMNMLRAAFSGMAPGDTIVYNAYFHGVEVAVVGYQYSEDGHTYTKPLAILVDESMFDQLRVDGESGRINGDKDDVQPARVI